MFLSCIKQRNKKLVTPLDHPGSRTEVNSDLLPSIRPIIRVTEGAGIHPRSHREAGKRLDRSPVHREWIRCHINLTFSDWWGGTEVSPHTHTSAFSTPRRLR